MATRKNTDENKVWVANVTGGLIEGGRTYAKGQEVTGIGEDRIDALSKMTVNEEPMVIQIDHSEATTGAATPADTAPATDTTKK